MADYDSQSAQRSTFSVADRRSDQSVKGFSASPLRALVFVSIAVALGLSPFAASGDTATTEAPATTVAPESADTTAPPTTAAPDSTEEATSTTLSAEQQEEKDRAVANLNVAKAADVEIAAQLKAINAEANATVEKIEAAKKRIEEAAVVAEQSRNALSTSDVRQREIEDSLRVKAVEGFKTNAIGGASTLFSEGSINEMLRQNELLDQASSSTTELLEELRGLLADRRLANSEAVRASTEAKRAEAVLQAELTTLKDQQSSQLDLKSEAERRIDQWAGELTAYAKEDAAIQDLIGETATPVDTAINTPTTPSELGFQWPIEGRVSSEYGYRVHPIYGTRRLHAGLDVAAPAGTPIASSADGVVIFSGTQGGYGQTVIVDHGGGITTLYAHMSRLGSSNGQQVSRGEVIGYVGTTGSSTGNHLHFEVRVNGGPADPRGYLP